MVIVFVMVINFIHTSQANLIHTWSYSLSSVKSGIENWLESAGLEAHDVMFFMCFFVNNQYRILVAGGQAGSDNLETIFEMRLTRIGRMVALLDAWDEPAYLTRVWTIFEQYTASTLGIAVEIILPEQQRLSILSQFRQGEAGIQRVKQSLCKVNSEAARAFDARDEAKVKALIRSSAGGFAEVNANVQRAMVGWIGKVVAQFMQQVVDGDLETRPAAPQETSQRLVVLIDGHANTEIDLDDVMPEVVEA